MKVGYIRISTAEQNTARQEVLMNSLGVEQVYIDKMSGKNTDRPQLRKMMSFVREGDTVIVESISRFARNTRDLLDLVEQLTKKKVEFVSKKEAIDTTTPTGKFMLTIFGAVAELEREYILQRQREGIAIAKENGIYKGRIAKSCPKFEAVVSQWKSGRISAVEAMKQLGMKKTTFYRRVKGGEINVSISGFFGNDRSAHNREAESGNEEVIKMNDEAKKNFEKVITVIGEILEGVLLAITVYFSKKD